LARLVRPQLDNWLKLNSLERLRRPLTALVPPGIKPRIVAFLPQPGFLSQL